jgi:hypothetical protein
VTRVDGIKDVVKQHAMTLDTDRAVFPSFETRWEIKVEALRLWRRPGVPSHGGSLPRCFLLNRWLDKIPADG